MRSGFRRITLDFGPKVTRLAILPVTGDISLVNPSASDIAEDVDIDDEQINLEPGTVLTIGAEGKLL
jgi:hypothetical protein